MKNILVFVNPKSRQGAQFGEEIKEWLRKEDFNVLNDSFDPQKNKLGDVIKKHQNQAPVVLIGGGDGSVNEALPALIETKLPLLLIPLGTANNLARTLAIPTEWTEAIGLLKNKGRIQKVDVGLANEIPFVNVVGLGLSTQVNRFTRKELKRWFGVFAFIYTALKIVLRMSPFKFTVEYDGQIHTGRTWQVTICNGRNYGNGLVIHENASLQDQMLHGLSTEVRHWWHAFALIPALITGRFKNEDSVAIFKGQKVSLNTKRPMHVDIDGDIKTKTPLTLAVMPQALSVYVPDKKEKEDLSL